MTVQPFLRNQQRLDQLNEIRPIEPICNHIFTRIQIIAILLHKNVQYCYFSIFILLFKYIFSIDPQHQPICLNIFTVLNMDDNIYLAIRPIPAPQSKTLLGTKLIFFEIQFFKKSVDPAISIQLRFPYPFNTPL